MTISKVIEVVAVVAYNPAWQELFKQEAARIQQALGENCIAIHHIGSTAVPGLSAKPIIDIIPVVTDILHVDETTSAMQQLGYEAKGEYGMLFRRYFQKGTATHRTHNVHVFETHNPEIERHLKFRDWMRNHVTDRDAYGALKQTLAARFPNDIMAYCFAKDAFVADIDTKTGFNGLRVTRALTEREWAAITGFRQKYFFDKRSIIDPYTWTFQHADHIHLSLYQGSKIMGYAHIQLWPQHRAALRIIVIDEPYRNQGIGSQFLKICERWLQQQGIHILHVESSPAAYSFYCQHDYLQMPFNNPEGDATHPPDIAVGKFL